MNKDTILETVKSKPFKPFVIHLPGMSFPVDDPSTIAISPKRDVAVVFLTNGSYHAIDITKITTLETT